MKTGFYLKLAISSMKKNKRLYLPYILTCMGMVMMQYIVVFLSVTPVFKDMKGAMSLQMMLGFGGWVIAIFSVIFLYYTNSFLMRRRRKEFGLYNILGMDKFNIGRVLFYETLLTAVLALAAGIGLGIVISKAAELSLMNVMRGDISYTISVSGEAVTNTALCFCAIFLLILVSSLIRLSLSNPISMLRSENYGEKKPKGNWLLAFAGLAFTVMAYYMAVTIEDPVSALMMFFIAVVMVIAGTYLLFISGSVVMCGALKKNKKYYYNPKHFVSVSSMAYRMKRNGAGLASICILGTMVLVMTASTSCLYFGAEDAMRSRYPRDINIVANFAEAEDMSSESADMLRGMINAAAEREGADENDIIDYRYVQATAIAGEDGYMDMNISYLSEVSGNDVGKVCQLYFIPLEDYNEMTNQEKHLGPDQALIYVNRSEYAYDRIRIEDKIDFKIVGETDESIENPNAAMNALTTVFIIVRDFESCAASLSDISAELGGTMISNGWNYGFNTGLSEDGQIGVKNAVEKELDNVDINRELSFSATCENFAENRDDFYGTFGSMFFLGIMLSTVFIFAAVLIIYYKQIAEGYEDQSRFDIMQKVGMTKREIRKSINSQLLTVFFLPLCAAGVHLAFAFPMLRKMLMLFNIVNVKLLIATTALSFLAFALFYMIVYRITSNAYYKIVAKK